MAGEGGRVDRGVGGADNSSVAELAERPDQPERPERPARPERPDGTDGPDRPDGDQPDQRGPGRGAERRADALRSMAAAEDPAFAGTPDRDTAPSPGESRPADFPSPRSPDASEKIDTALRKADLPSPADDHTHDVEDHAPDAGKPKPGDLVAEPEVNDKESRFDRLRGESFKVAENLTKGADQGAETVEKVLSSRPPTGHPEVRAPKPTGSEMAPHYADHAGDVAGMIVASSLIAVDVGRRVHGKITQIRERRHDGDR